MVCLHQHILQPTRLSPKQTLDIFQKLSSLQKESMVDTRPSQKVEVIRTPLLFTLATIASTPSSSSSPVPVELSPCRLMTASTARHPSTRLPLFSGEPVVFGTKAEDTASTTRNETGVPPQGQAASSVDPSPSPSRKQIQNHRLVGLIPSPLLLAKNSQ